MIKHINRISHTFWYKNRMFKLLINFKVFKFLPINFKAQNKQKQIIKGNTREN